MTRQQVRRSTRGTPRAPIQLRSFHDLLNQLHRLDLLPPLDLGHERWLYLWTGTLRLLEAQEPRAYRRVLAKLERHGLVGPAPDFRRNTGRLIVGERITAVSGLLSSDFGRLADAAPSNRRAAIQRAEARLREQFRRYAEDGQRIAPRRSLRSPPRIVLLMAYYGARWKLKQEVPPRRRGESLADRAMALVAPRFGLTTEAARSTIKRTHAKLPKVWRTFLTVTEGKILWENTMAPDVDRPRLTLPKVH